MTKIEALRKAGFSLETFEDGKFWVCERKPGEESEKSLAVCRRYIEGFGDPVLYIDGFLWQLSPRVFWMWFEGWEKSGRE